MGFTAKHQDGTEYWHATTPGEGLDSPPCGGSGILHCHCGGDLCVCGNFGTAECPGCIDCMYDDDDDYDDCEDEDWWDEEE